MVNSHRTVNGATISSFLLKTTLRRLRKIKEFRVRLIEKIETSINSWTSQEPSSAAGVFEDQFSKDGMKK